MSLRFSVLASGSSGNAMIVATKKQKLLVDAGLSGKKLEAAIRKIGFSPNELHGILVTHEHSDHVKGLGVFARRYNLPVYANEKTWEALEEIVGDLPLEQRFHFSLGTVKTFVDLDVESFAVSHDAVDPMFFNFYHNGKKITLLTDTGYVSDRMKGIIRNADIFVFEANHDVQMLMMGKYPWNVKRRILGDLGHVSNEEAGYALADVIGSNTRRIYLAHLSKDNNMKDLARMSVQQTLESKGIVVGDQLELHDTDPNVPTTMIAI